MRVPALLLAMMIPIGCAPKLSFTPAQRLAGDWVCTMDGSLAHLDADGTWTFLGDTEGERSPQHGAFEATWTSIRFQADSGPCVGIKGSYDYILSRDALMFSRNSDDCEARSIRLDYVWTRALEPAIPEVEQGEVEAESNKQ